jgi:hypothetical protein
MFNNFFSPENRAVFETTSKNKVEAQGSQMTQHDVYAFYAG